MVPVLVASIAVAVSMIAVPGCGSDPSELQVEVKIEGQGTVTSSMPGIFCRSGDAMCAATFRNIQRTTVALTAAAEEGWHFSRWRLEVPDRKLGSPRSRTQSLRPEDGVRQVWVATFEEHPGDLDGGHPPVDAGEEPLDGGGEDPDAGTPDPDAGTPDPDAGTEVPDAGIDLDGGVVLDGGTVDPDGGVLPLPDAGLDMDGGILP